MKKIFILFIVLQGFTPCLKTIARDRVAINLPAQGDTLKSELQKAQTLAKQGNTKEASGILTGIMQSHPDNKQAVQWWLMMNMKRTPTGELDAVKQLDSLSAIFPANTGILFFKSFILAEYGKNEEALVLFDQLIRLQPDTAVNFIGKGQVLHATGHYGEALEAFNKSLFLAPERTDLYGMKAATLIMLGKYDEALASANKGIELSPGNPSAIYNRACIYTLKGDKTAALADLKRAFDMNPALKQHARQDEDLKSLWEDEDFKNLTK